RHARKVPIAGLALLEHVDDTLTAAHIDSVALRVYEHIVGLAAGLDLGRHPPVLTGKRHQCWRAAKDDENPAPLTVDRHRKIRSRALRRQRSVRLRCKVHHLDLAGIRHIDKNLGSSLVDLKTLRMALET